jgi:hypothetical protein
MRITYKNIDRIEFPIYPLESDNLYMADSILWLDNQVVDDRNMPGKTLGARRIQSPFTTLYELSKALPAKVSMIRSPSRTYIDNLGRIFTYEKTQTAQLEYRNIRKVEKKGTYSVIWFAGFNFPFEVPRPPPEGHTWAGILYLYGFPWILYEYSTDRKKKTRRRV